MTESQMEHQLFEAGTEIEASRRLAQYGVFEGDRDTVYANLARARTRIDAVLLALTAREGSTLAEAIQHERTGNMEA